MGTTKIDDELLNRVGEIVKNNPIDYPSVKNLIDKAIRKFIERNKGDV